MRDKIQLDAKALRKWRTDRGFSQSFMAGLIGCGINTLGDWEQDGRVHPRWFARMHAITAECAPYLSSDRSNERDHDPGDVLNSAASSLDATRLIEWRRYVGLSPEQLATRLGPCTAAMVAQWERDGMVSPTMLGYMRGIHSEYQFEYRLKQPPHFLVKRV